MGRCWTALHCIIRYSKVQITFYIVLGKYEEGDGTVLDRGPTFIALAEHLYPQSTAHKLRTKYYAVQGKHEVGYRTAPGQCNDLHCIKRTWILPVLLTRYYFV